MSAWNELKSFLFRGDVLALAVAFVIGAAFSAVVNALVNDIITPLISIPGTANFSSFQYKIGGGTFTYGAFLQTVINFVLIALAIFFILVRPSETYQKRREAKKAAAPPTTKDCPFCLMSIPIKATRCGFCTSNLPVSA